MAVIYRLFLLLTEKTSASGCTWLVRCAEAISKARVISVVASDERTEPGQRGLR